jgi:hypothetical protein
VYEIISKNTLLNGRQNEEKDEEEDVSSYRMILRKREEAVI